MKIIIPVDNKTAESSVCISFGRTPCFMLFDSENSSYSFIDNDAAESQGGAGIKAAQLIVDSEAETLITMRCGQNAADVLNAANIKIYKSAAGTAKENIAMLKQGELSLLTEIHAGLHNHGGGME